MARVVGIGHQDFETVIQKNCFYIDKTEFIREWWENNDAVTLITRPRRFGKTLNMSIVYQFFRWIMLTEEICLRGFPYGVRKSTGRSRGTYPVISFSFCRAE